LPFLTFKPRTEEKLCHPATTSDGGGVDDLLPHPPPAHHAVEDEQGLGTRLYRVVDNDAKVAAFLLAWCTSVVSNDLRIAPFLLSTR
jgi:hypothetical protein